jgi:hypothetical protein
MRLGRTNPYTKYCTLNIVKLRFGGKGLGIQQGTSVWVGSPNMPGGDNEILHKSM